MTKGVITSRLSAAVGAIEAAKVARTGVIAATESAAKHLPVIAFSAHGGLLRVALRLDPPPGFVGGMPSSMGTFGPVQWYSRSLIATHFAE